MRICLVNCYPASNIGDEAIALGSLYLLKETFPGCRISCHTFFPAGDSALKARFRPYLQNKSLVYPGLVPTAYTRQVERDIPRPMLLLYLLRGLLLFVVCLMLGKNGRFILANRTEREAVLDICSADLVVNSGGLFFGDVKGLIGFLLTLVKTYPLCLSIAQRRATIILGASMGPFFGVLTRWHLRKLTENIPRIFLREPWSKRFLLEAGVDEKILKVVPDLAFRLDQALNSRFGFVNENGNTGDIAVVLCAPSRNDDLELAYYQGMANLVDYLIESKQVRIFLVLHVKVQTAKFWERDDLSCAAKFAEFSRNKASLSVIQFPDSPENLMAFYRRMDLVISSRVHGAILSRPVPVLAMPTLFGYRLAGVMKLLGLSEYCIEWNAPFLRQKELVDSIWRDRARIESEQNEVVRRIRTELQSLGRDLKVIVGRDLET